MIPRLFYLRPAPDGEGWEIFIQEPPQENGRTVQRVYRLTANQLVRLSVESTDAVSSLFLESLTDA